MPRHRLEGRPRHRAKRQGFWPERRVRLDAGLTQDLATIGSAGGRTEDTRPAGRRAKESSRRRRPRNRPATVRPFSGRAKDPGAARRPGSRAVSTWREARGVGKPAPAGRPGGRAEYVRMLRGAMMTPWFAVSVGIVVATSLTLVVPHPALRFPPTKSGHCLRTDCLPQPVPAESQAPAIKQDTPLPGASHPATQDSAEAHPAVNVGYGLLPPGGRRFIAMIVIKGHEALGNWTLRFRLPGAQISKIIWGHWTREGSDGVLVSGSQQVWARSDPNEARIVIFGFGKPGWPAGCSFDGVSCVFRKLTSVTGQQTVPRLPERWRRYAASWSRE